MTKPPYERVVAAVAGPLSIVSGWLGLQVTNHLNIFGSLGLSATQTTHIIQSVGSRLPHVATTATAGQSAIGHAIFDALVFGVGALATLVPHVKWLSNVEKWWTASGLTAPATLPPPDTTSSVSVDQSTPPEPDAPGSPILAAAIYDHQQSTGAPTLTLDPHRTLDGAQTDTAPAPDPAAALRAQLSAAGLTPSA